MAMNPMQRKSRISFLLGMLLTLVIAGVAIVFLMNQIRETNEEMAVYESATISVLNQDVKSGQIITADMLVPMRVHPNMVPNNTDGVEALFENDYMVDQNGKRILGNVETGLYYEDEEGSTNMTSITKGNDGKYYAKNGTTTTEVKIYGTPIIAKIDIGANTPLTTDMLARTDNVVSADVRLKEYNMIDLPATLAEGEFIDIRLTLPSGQDYIVISKKEVKQCDLTTVWIEVTEDEMLTMSNAIIESYMQQDMWNLVYNKHLQQHIQ